MQGFIASMSWPLLLCLVLSSLLTFLGQRTLERGRVVVNLALAQVAGLGAAWGVMLGWSVDADPWVVRAFAAGFALVAAAALTGLRGHEGQLPREAVAGALYALAVAATMLIGATLHHGAEEVRDLLAGKILFVRPGNVAGAAVLYAAIGVFLHRFRAHMRPRTMPSKKGTKTVQVPVAPLWEFLFFAALGLAVSYPVPLIGVPLVFAYLLLPAATGALLSARTEGRLLAGWIAAALGTLLGLGWAYARNLPAEPSIAVCLGLLFLGALVRRHLATGGDRIGGAISVLASIAFAAMLLAWTFQLRAREEPVDWTAPDAPSGQQVALVARLDLEPERWERERAAVLETLTGGAPEVRADLLDRIAARGDVTLLAQAEALLVDPDDLVRDSALNCVRTLGQASSVPALIAAAQTERDEYLKLELGDTLLSLGSDAGFEPLLQVMATGEAEFARADAFERLRNHHPELSAAAYDASADAQARAAAVERLRDDR